MFSHIIATVTVIAVNNKSQTTTVKKVEFGIGLIGWIWKDGFVRLDLLGLEIVIKNFYILAVTTTPFRKVLKFSQVPTFDAFP